MRAAVAAVALLAAAAIYRRRVELVDQAGPADQADPWPLLADETGSTGQVAAYWPQPDDPPPADPLAGFEDAAAPVLAPMLGIVNRLRGTSAADMVPSAAGLAAIQRHESLRLTRYRLGDGGYTIGWGRFYPDGGPVPPERIDRATADAWFAEDVEARGARWVRAYVTADLTQPQFDALVSMAYNLSPRSFRTIAEAVNRGDDPETAALQFVRAGTNLERGLRNRRAAELAVYRADPATYG